MIVRSNVSSVFHADNEPAIPAIGEHLENFKLYLDLLVKRELLMKPVLEVCCAVILI